MDLWNLDQPFEEALIKSISLRLRTLNRNELHYKERKEDAFIPL